MRSSPDSMQKLLSLLKFLVFPTTLNVFLVIANKKEERKIIK